MPMYANSPFPRTHVHKKIYAIFNLGLILNNVNKVQNVINVCCLLNLKFIGYHVVKLDTYNLIKLNLSSLEA
jgi:hypothetical protein